MEQPEGGAGGPRALLEMPHGKGAQRTLQRIALEPVVEQLGDTVIDTLSEYAPNLKGAILHRQVITPADIERVIGLSEGNIFQGELTLQQMFFLRPAPAWSRYRTPIHGLFQCGSGTHPGGGVMGASGRNAALEILGRRA